MSEEDIKRRHRSVVRELNGLKEKHLKIKAHCTSLMEKFKEKTQELEQREQELDQTKHELDLGYSLGTSMYQYLSYYYRGYYDLLSHFQWSGRPSSGGATIIKIDSNEMTPIHENAIAMLPQRYRAFDREAWCHQKHVRKDLWTPTKCLPLKKETDSRTTLIARSVYFRTTASVPESVRI